jgi:BASS family bile acid:Na+ symporter
MMSIQKVRSLVLPIAIVLGFLFSDFLTSLSFAVPYLIAVMLYLSCVKVEIKQCKMSPLFLYLIGFQIMMCIVFYIALHFWDEQLAQGIFVTALAPTATASVVIATMLGANINTMFTYTLLCNLCVSVLAPVCFAIINPDDQVHFAVSCGTIFAKVFPLLIFPLLLALITRKTVPVIHALFVRHSQWSFYLWAISLVIVIGKTITLTYHHASNRIFIYMAIASGCLCIVQFAIGRYWGRKYHDPVAGGQALGQKNTVLAIWMAQTYLMPLACVIPAMYVIWQNLANSYQLWKKKEINTTRS